MKVRFLGPVGKVTGSCTWMWDEARGWNFLVDCGMQQGESSAPQWNRSEWPFNPREIQFVVLTHAHVDHCGLLPALYKQGFTGPVYCSRETAKLANLLLKDAAKLADLGYSPADVDAIRWHEPGTGQFFGKFHPVGQDLFLWFYRAGHVVGAVSAAVFWGAPKSPNQRSIVFSGDLGPNEEDAESLPFLRHRMGVCPHDFAVAESTYGATVRDPITSAPAARRSRLGKLLDRTLDTGGTLIIPAFALGRTQDVLFDLHWLAAEDPDRYGSLPVFLDSPSARKIHEVVLEALERTESNGRKAKVRPLWLGKQMFTWFGLDDENPAHVRQLLRICKATLGHPDAEGSELDAGNTLAKSWRGLVRPVPTRERVAEALSDSPSVLVVSSGTCDGGPAAWWLPRLLGDRRNTVALAGFCGPSTVGGRLLALANLPENERRRLSARLSWSADASCLESDVRCEIAQLEGYSAHADQSGLLKWLFGEFEGELTRAGKVAFIQHGTEFARTALKEAIEQRRADPQDRVEVVLPTADAVYDLDGPPNADAELRQIEEKLAQLEARRRMLRGESSGQLTAKEDYF